MCRNCPKRNLCREEIEISMPIRLGGRSVGVIGLIGSSREQKERILGDEDMYLELLEHRLQALSRLRRQRQRSLEDARRF